MKKLTIEEFLKMAEEVPVIDVRTSAEYEQGHITGAYNIPLFSNQERVSVGTTYKKSGRDVAVLEGLKYVGPKMHNFIIQLRKIVKGKSRKVLVHCWRGGMRSESMVWLFNMAGFDAYLLDGGYKSYRAYIRNDFASERKLIVLGGYTGSGKTEILKKLERKGEQIIDLEGLANHKGSVYGGLGQDVQPTNEQFENDSWAVWNKLDPDKPIWIEDESRSIGTVGINNPLYTQMCRSNVLFIDLPIEERIARLKKEYAIFDVENLKILSQKIQKKLGGNNLKDLLESLENGDIENAIRVSLRYYDKAYLKGLDKRVNVYKIGAETISEKLLNEILDYKSLVC